MAKPSLFSSKNRTNILKNAVGKPSGVIAEVGGVEFDLRPFSNAETTDVFDLVKRLAGLLSGKMVEPEALAQIVGDEGPAILKLVSTVLKRSVRYDEGYDDAIFDAWFGELNLFDLLKTLIPKVIEANGLTEVLSKRPLKPAGEVAAD